jgi:thiamine pyrophosphokinase
MKQKIAIIANGLIENKKLHKELLKDFDIFICADGGANNAKELDITPDYIVGDFDSITTSVFNHFKERNKTKMIKDKNQNKTDLEIAINLAEKLNPSEITIFGATGNRIDHTLANIYCLDKIKPEIKAKIVDNKNTIELLKKNTEIKSGKNDIISVIPISDVNNLNYTGFKWNVKNLDTQSGWFGLSNKIEKNNANINFSKGKVLVIRVRNK